MLLNFNLLSLIYCLFNSYICNLKKNITQYKSKENDESRYRSDNFRKKRT